MFNKCIENAVLWVPDPACFLLEILVNSHCNKFYLFLQTFWLRCHSHGPADSGVINIKPCPLYREILQELWQENEVLRSSAVKAPLLLSKLRSTVRSQHSSEAEG